MDKKEMIEELTELKTKVALLEDRIKQLDDHPTLEKTENMINRSIENIPKEEKIIVLIQDSIKKENLATIETVEKKLSKLKVWLYGTAVSLVGMALSFLL